VQKSSTSKPYEIYKDEVENDQMNLERIVNKVQVSNVPSLLTSDQQEVHHLHDCRYRVEDPFHCVFFNHVQLYMRRSKLASVALLWYTSDRGAFFFVTPPI
jgi:uncharacterized protein YdaL